MNSHLLLLILTLFGLTYSNNFATVVIIGTNDIHGTAFPTQLFRSDTNQSYSYGGLQYMATMIQSVRSKNQGNVLWLDAGDQFQGGIQASPLVSSGQIMNDFYNTLKVDGSAIGNHQFDFGPNFLFPYWAGRADPSPNLAANIQSETDQQQFLPKQKNTFLYALANGIKIGVIGLTTLQTPSTTGAFAEGLFPQYKFKQYANIVTEKSELLRRQGAHAVLIVSHVGNDCNADATYGEWDVNTKQSSSCSGDDEISTLLKTLERGTVDGVVQGHRHKFSHHFINGVPVMGTINGGYYFNIMTFKFYNKEIFQKKIEGPVPVCQRIFQNIKRCNYLQKKELEVAGELTTWSFYGKEVTPHQQLSAIFTEKWLPKMSQFLQPLANNQIVLQKYFDRQYELGNLITHIMSSACSKSDFVLANGGGFRSMWMPGVIQFQHFYSMFPFSNTLVSFEMTGYELIQTLKILQGGKKGFYPAYGLKQRVSISSNGTKKFLSARFSNGEQIELGRNYRGVSINFCLEGGDDFKDVMGKVYTLRKERVEGEMRDMLKQELKKLGVIRGQSLIDPLHPRLQIDYV